MRCIAILFAAFAAVASARNSNKTLSSKPNKGNRTITTISTSPTTNTDKPVPTVKIEYTKLKMMDKNKANALKTTSLVQPNANDPSAHNLHRILAYWREGTMTRLLIKKKMETLHPILQFWLRGELDELQVHDLKDITLLFTELEPHDIGFTCPKRTFEVAIETMKIDKDGNITDRKTFESYTVDDVDSYKVGYRFRLSFRNIFKKHKDLSYKEFFVTIKSSVDCARLFLVELEEPNNYGDAVAKAT